PSGATGLTLGGLFWRRLDRPDDRLGLPGRAHRAARLRADPGRPADCVRDLAAALALQRRGPARTPGRTRSRHRLRDGAPQLAPLRLLLRAWERRASPGAGGLLDPRALSALPPRPHPAPPDVASAPRSPPQARRRRAVRC